MKGSNSVISSSSEDDLPEVNSAEVKIFDKNKKRESKKGSSRFKKAEVI